MSFEASVFFISFALPLAIGIVAVCGAWWNQNRSTSWISGLVVNFGWWLASASALFLHTRSLWSDDSWRNGQWILLALGLVAGTSFVCCEFVAWRPMTIALGLIAVVWIALPRGDGWADMYPVMLEWFAFSTMAGIANSYALEQRAQTTSKNWVMWIALGALGSASVLAAGCYASLAEWSISIIAATLPCAVWAVFYPERWTQAILVQTMASLSLLAPTARLYGADPMLMSVILLSPSGLALVDRALQMWLPSFWRVFLIGMLSAGLFVWMLWSTLGG